MTTPDIPGLLTRLTEAFAVLDAWLGAVGRVQQPASAPAEADGTACPI